MTLIYRNSKSSSTFLIVIITELLKSCNCWSNFHLSIAQRPRIQKKMQNLKPKLSANTLHLSSNNDNNNYDDGQNPNFWSSEDKNKDRDDEIVEDWQDQLKKRQDNTVWSSIYDEEDETNAAIKNDNTNNNNINNNINVDEEALLDTLQSITAEEVEFMTIEAERADKMRQMQEFGFSSESISATLGVATDESEEVSREDNPLLEEFRETTSKTGSFGQYVDDLTEIDISEVESHTTAERDEDTDELIRSQMVYVDEVTCIGCTNCAMIAQSTFFMHEEHGRARVFQQWGDDDETIAIAIETCPVDCIHYIPYPELKRLEVERRDQNINAKARLVNQDAGGSHRGGGAFKYTEAQKISGNMQSRCRNCPSAGCINCPMYGVGENPDFKKREKKRNERRARKQMQEQLRNSNKAADL